MQTMQIAITGVIGGRKKNILKTFLFTFLINFKLKSFLKKIKKYIMVPEFPSKSLALSEIGLL